jgi:tetratricopeptide (TPR) repeat protein
VHAGSAARFEEGYRTIAERVRLPGCSKPDTDILRLVHNWLSDENNGRWVMIVDNADDINVFTCPSDRHRGQKNDVSGGAVTTLLKFLPQSPNGSFLITSRSRDAAFQLTGNYSDIITVHPMAQQAALALLRNKLGRSCEQEDDAGLVEALDYMPLAIAQAAAYISRRSPRATVSTYLHDIHKGDRDRAELLEVDLGDARRDGASSNSVLATWQISFEYIRAVRPTATELLSLMSLFDRQGIPESMLAFCYGDGKDASSTFEEDLSMLIGFSLVAADIDGHKFEMHRLVQFSTRKWLELQGELETWKDGYAAIMNHFYPDGSYETWKVCQELFPHALAARTCRPTDSNALENWASVLYKAALYADEMANYETALELGRLALEAEEQVLGPEHHDTLLSSKLVSGILLHQGSLGGLSAVDLQSAECRELGPKNADSPTDVCLGLAPESQLKYEEAEAMIRRRLEVCERTLGPEHPETLVSVGRLALARARLGRVEEAEVMPQRALKLLEQVLGPDHPTSVSTLNTVGVILEAQGKYEEAETIFRQVLGSYERVMGSEHPTTLVTVNNLGAVLEKQERYEETEPLYRRALQGYEKILGPKHPDTLMTLHRLRLVLGEGLGKHQEAEALHSRVTKT